MRRAAVLPLVPAQQVDNVWLNALVDNDDNSIQTIKFKDYVTETWVEGSIQGLTTTEPEQLTISRDGIVRSTKHAGVHNPTYLLW